MTDSPIVTILLIAAVAAVALVALALYPTPEEPEEGRVLQFVRVEDAEAGFSNSTIFRVDEDYQRLGLSYVIMEAAHVRANVTDPQGRVYNAQPVAVEHGTDRLVLNIDDPLKGTWWFTLWTLDDDERQGYIVAGDFYILGFGGPRAPAG